MGRVERQIMGKTEETEQEHGDIDVQVDQAVENMRIWHRVADVPEELLSPYTTFKGKKLTSIPATWYFREATKLWGPLGDGWNFKIVKDEIVAEKYHVMHVLVGDAREGDPDSIPRYRALLGVGCVNNNEMGANFAKAALTGAITNALSRLGFGADVRLSDYGDSDLPPATAHEGNEAAWEALRTRAADHLRNRSRAITPEEIDSLTFEG